MAVTNILLQESEVAAKKLSKNTLTIIKHIFDVHGFVKIENVFCKKFIESLREAYEGRLELMEEDLSSGAKVSHGRYIVPISFTHPFNAPELYANPLVIEIMKELLGPHFILSSLGAVTALPGSMDQHLHADYYPLFEDNVPLSQTLPPFAITFAVPLIDIDLVNGPTKIWSGSHKSYPCEETMKAYTKHHLFGPTGCCYFWDVRTFHLGGSNHSDRLRSLLYMSYTRRWFKDFSNPDFLLIEEEEVEKIPEEHRSLFSQLMSHKVRK